ncbi:MAG: hypothetical protein DRO67_01395 [Candidatus Asgardarchaeum californiense]|nr:MAG: hypothetical protein DRO67_01395 [Candidatus Asgardarchaeum californiense]
MMKNVIIFSIAKKEVIDNIRNKWIIIISIIFALLALLASYAGSIYSEGWQDLGTTIAIMLSLVQLLVPIIALMLGYAAVIGETERGSMSSLLSLPTTRLEIILGKFFGLGSIISLTILIGFGIAGIIISMNVSDVNYIDYLIFIGATILIGLAFLTLALFLSCLFKKRSTAMGGAIFSWFLFVVLWGLIMSGLLIASGASIEGLLSGSLPDWYYAIQLFNPISVYSSLVSLNVGPVSATQQGFPISYPSFYSSELMLLILIVWIVLFLFLAFWKFSRSDI